MNKTQEKTNIDKIYYEKYLEFKKKYLELKLKQNKTKLAQENIKKLN
jgi:hypothetical protein